MKDNALVPLSDSNARSRIQSLLGKKDCLSRLHQLMTACRQSLSPEILSLPWSARHKQMPVARCITRLLQLVDEDISSILGERFLNLPAIMLYEAELLHGKPHEHAEQMYESWEGPLLCAMMEYSRALQWGELKGVTYELTGPLMDLMMQTEIDPDIPIRLVQPPFPMISIKPESSRTFQELGFHLLHDFPIDEIIVSRVEGEDNDGEILGLELLAPFVRPGEAIQSGMSLFSEIHLPIDKDDDTPITDRLRERISIETRGKGSEESLEDWIELVTFLLKILLYIGVPSARQVNRYDYTDAITAARNEKSPQRRDKLEKLAKKKYDRIVIGPEQIPSEPSSFALAGKREMPTHWRRGFLNANGTARECLLLNTSSYPHSWCGLTDFRMEAKYRNPKNTS